MTISELGSIGELLAAIATLVTLAYLALQIRQSNRTHQLSAVTRIGESTESWLGQVVQDPVLLDVYSRGLRDPDSLDRDERWRFNLLVLQFLRGVETGWIQVQWGIVEREFWEGFCKSVRVIVGSPAGRRAFESNRDLLTPRFAAEVQAIIDGERNGGA
jgi:hypothetical protein